MAKWVSKKMEAGQAWTVWAEAAGCFGGMVPSFISPAELALAGSVEAIRAILARAHDEVLDMGGHAQFNPPARAWLKILSKERKKVRPSKKGRPLRWEVSFGAGRTEAVVTGDGFSDRLRVIVRGPVEATSSIRCRVQQAQTAGAKGRYK